MISPLIYKLDVGFPHLLHPNVASPIPPWSVMGGLILLSLDIHAP